MNELNTIKLFEIAEEMEQLIGTKELLNDLIKQMSEKELHEALEYIDRMNDTNLFN